MPIDAKGNISFFFPIVVYPVILTCECIFVFSSISTFGPITEKAPTSTLFAIFALSSIIAVGWIINY